MEQLYMNESGDLKVSMGSIQTDLAMAFLREQHTLINELIGSLEKESISRNVFCQKVFTIENGLKRLRSVL